MYALKLKVNRKRKKKIMKTQNETFFNKRIKQKLVCSMVRSIHSALRKWESFICLFSHKCKQTTQQDIECVCAASTIVYFAMPTDDKQKVRFCQCTRTHTESQLWYSNERQKQPQHQYFQWVRKKDKNEIEKGYFRASSRWKWILKQIHQRQTVWQREK